MGALGKLKWLFRLKRLADAATEEVNVYDWKLSAGKALLEAGKSLLAVMAVAGLGYLANNEVVTAILSKAGLSTALTAAAVPVIHAAIEYTQNWLKHKD